MFLSLCVYTAPLVFLLSFEVGNSHKKKKKPTVNCVRIHILYSNVTYVGIGYVDMASTPK